MLCDGSGVGRAHPTAGEKHGQDRGDAARITHEICSVRHAAFRFRNQNGVSNV